MKNNWLSIIIQLNAVGRLDNASLACELLMTDDEEEAAFLAERIETF
ncbi:hypothetical protein ACVNP0_11825 [Staphylococcus aureus]